MTRFTRIMKCIVLSLVLGLCGLGSAGCSGTQFSIPNTPERAYDLAGGRQITSVASGFQLLLVIPIGVNQRHERAWRELQRQAPDDFITDVIIQDSWTWALVGTIYTVQMEATAFPYLEQPTADGSSFAAGCWNRGWGASAGP